MHDGRGKVSLTLLELARLEKQMKQSGRAKGKSRLFHVRQGVESYGCQVQAGPAS